MVGLLPLAAVAIFDEDTLERLYNFGAMRENCMRITSLI